MRSLVRRYRDLILEAARFGVVGGAATLTYIVVSLIASFAGLQAYLASTTGYLASVGISYFGHGKFTFRSDEQHRVTGPRFLVLTLMVYGLTNFLVYVVTAVLERPFWIATLVVAVSIPLLTWLLARFWVFRSSANGDRSGDGH